MIARPLAWARSLWRGLRRRTDVETEVDEEFRLHIEMRAEDLVRRFGIDPAEAKRRAHIEFGSVEKYKEQGRASRGLGPFDQLRFSLLDVRLGVRMLIKYPALTLVGILSLAFAVFVGTFGFELLTRVVFPRISFEQPGRIVQIHFLDPVSTRNQRMPRSVFLSWRDQVTSIEGLGVGFNGGSAMGLNLITGEGRGEPLPLRVTSAATFALTGVRPLLGRPLLESDEISGAPAVIVLAYEVWKHRMASDPRVIGSTVRLEDEPYTVVGVMPKGFSLPEPFVRGWIPSQSDAIRELIGRLAPGITIAEAEAELNRLSQRATTSLVGTENLRARVAPVARGELSKNARISAIATNIFLVLLVAVICSTVALLIFARAVTREGEIAVRTALGAGRGRIVMQLIAESLVLAAVASGIGLTAADAALRWNLGFPTFGYMDGTGLAPATVLYAGLLTALAVATLGLLPALKVTRGLAERLKRAALGSGGFKFGGLWTTVVVAQVAVTVAVPVAFLFASRDAEAIRSVTSDAGFATDEYLAFLLQSFPDSLGDAYREFERRLEAEPRVRNVTFGNPLPTWGHPSRRIELESSEAQPESRNGSVQVSAASVALDFFEAFDAPILAGRGFNTVDLESEAPVVVVNESFSDRVLGGRNAIGRRIRYLNSEEGGGSEAENAAWFEIIGVVRDLGLGVGDEPAAIYNAVAPGGVRLRVAAHVAGDPATFLPRLHEFAIEVSPLLRLDDTDFVEGRTAMTLDEINEVNLREPIVLLWFSTLVTAVAVALSLASIYAILSFTVWQRTREIGLRVALGADAKRIITLIFRRPLVQVGSGILVGGAGVAVLVSKGFADVSGRGAALLGAYALLMTAVCMLAAIVPIRRSLSIEPSEALKTEA